MACCVHCTHAPHATELLRLCPAPFCCRLTYSPFAPAPARTPTPVGVDISCTPKGSSFRGDKENRQQVRLKLMDMVEIAEAHELGKPHWATSEASVFVCVWFL